MAVNQLSATFIPHIIRWLILTQMLRSIIKSNCLRVLLTFEEAIIVFWPQVASWTRTRPCTVGLFHGRHFVIAAKAQVHLIFTLFSKPCQWAAMHSTGSGTGRPKWNGVIVNVSNYTCFFPPPLCFLRFYCCDVSKCHWCLIKLVSVWAIESLC